MIYAQAEQIVTFLPHFTEAGQLPAVASSCAAPGLGGSVPEAARAPSMTGFGAGGADVAGLLSPPREMTAGPARQLVRDGCGSCQHQETASGLVL